jgi:enoyl-CoA hydratase/carnithine racemase
MKGEAMHYQYIILEKQDKIATITLNRPDKLNAFNPQMYEELRRAATEVSNDDSIRVGILSRREE